MRVEVLDFAGPFKVFSLASLSNSNQKTIYSKTISENEKMI